jgi:hypothetical protein
MNSLIYGPPVEWPYEVDPQCSGTGFKTLDFGLVLRDLALDHGE